MKKIIVLSAAMLILLITSVGCNGSNALTELQGNFPLNGIVDIIEGNLDTITEPSPDSNPYHYINSHKSEYDEIVALGDDALQYMFSIFDMGGQSGLRGWIMAIACCDILGENTEFATSSVDTGQKWYDAYITNDQTQMVQSPNALVPSVMIEGTLYLLSQKENPVIEIAESDYSGVIMSTIPLSEWPTENEQANIDVEDAPYAEYGNGIVVLWNGEWTLFLTEQERFSEE
jgi:hypothetical protein